MKSESSSPVWIQYEEGVSRFSGHESLYRKYLVKFPEDPTFPELQDAMSRGDYDLAFRCAHTLKGSAGNLSLTALFEALKPFVEHLREGRDVPAAVAAFSHLEEVYRATLQAIDLQANARPMPY